jgi:hypothetical protein
MFNPARLALIFPSHSPSDSPLAEAALSSPLGTSCHRPVRQGGSPNTAVSGALRSISSPQGTSYPKGIPAG